MLIPIADRTRMARAGKVKKESHQSMIQNVVENLGGKREKIYHVLMCPHPVSMVLS